MTDPVFFAPSRRYTAGEVANLTGSTLVDSAYSDVLIDALAPASEGGERALVFVDGSRNVALMPSLRAAAVLCPADFAAKAPAGIAVLTHPRPQQAFAYVGRLLFPTAAMPGPMTGETGVSARAYVDPSAHVEEGAIIEAGAVIGPRASIGRGTVVAPNAVIGQSCQIGRDGYIGPGTSIQYALIGNRVIIHGGARIGQDGFGFVAGAKGPERVPQIGRVIIQDDVEIGSNSTVDRGAMSDTIIGQGTKIDNLVQIAHNVRIGRNCIVAGLSGISGSVIVGDNVTMGGGVGLADHLTIGTGAKLAARSGFMSNVPAGEIWGGYPAQPMAEAMREIAALRRLARTRKQGDGNG